MIKIIIIQFCFNNYQEPIMNQQMLCLAILTFFLGLCSLYYQNISHSNSQSKRNATTITTISDDYNSSITVNVPTKRIVAISSSDSELLLALGIEPVGLVNSKELPNSVQKEINKRNVMNTAITPNIEKIIQSDPDLLLGVNLPFQTAAKPIFQANNIPAIFHVSNSLNDSFNHILTVGYITGYTEKAQSLVTHYQKVLKDIQSKHKDTPKKKIIIVFGSPTSYQLATSNTYIGDLFKQIGAENAADQFILNKNNPSQYNDIMSGFIPLNLETMALLDCDEVYLVVYGNSKHEIDNFKNAFRTPAWNNIPAVQKGNFKVLPSNLFTFVTTARMDEVMWAAEKVLYEK